MKYVDLHVHDNGSIGDALGDPKQLADYALSLGCNSVAITNHGNMNTFPYAYFYEQELREKGIDFKFIYGIEAYYIDDIELWRQEYIKQDEKFSTKDSKAREEEEYPELNSGKINDRHHLVLLAKNQKGLENIFKIVSESHSNKYYYRRPRVDAALLRKYNEGVIASSACMSGVLTPYYWREDDKKTSKRFIINEMKQKIELFRDIFNDEFYLELQWNNQEDQMLINQYIIESAAELGLEDCFICTSDAHYPTPDLWLSREMYKKIALLNAKVKEQALPKNYESLGMQLHLHNGDQMYQLYEKYSKGYNFDDYLVHKAIEKTHEIAESIEICRFDSTVRLPMFPVKNLQEDTADSALRKLCKEGLKNKNLENNNTYLERLEYELNVIEKRGFSIYFLLMREMLLEASKTGIVGPARGSASGCLVSYLINITQVDPIRFGLHFERFLDPDSMEFPDIDADVIEPIQIKEHLAEIWKKQYGVDVVPVSNFNGLHLRSLIKDVSKYFNIPFLEVNNVTTVMFDEATPAAKEKNDIKAGVYIPTLEEVLTFSETLRAFLEKYPEVYAHISALKGAKKSISRHASAVVVGEEMSSRMPLVRSGGIIQTPWTDGQQARNLEPLGFLKFDLLGLATLEMIQQCIKNILRRHHGVQEPTLRDVREYYNNTLHPDVINFEDAKVYKHVFEEGNFPGIFQFTQYPVQKFCMSARPTKLMDISTITAIYRPGPLSVGMNDAFIKNRTERKVITNNVDKIYHDIFTETDGLLVYQEQIASLVHILGKDITLTEGNKLRKLLTKKGVRDAESKKEHIKQKFVAGCLEKGYSAQVANRIWSDIELQSGYLFNKSHSCSYSIISYQCAFLATYFTPEWLCAFLDKEPEERKENAINIARGMGYNIQKVDINKSGNFWEISEASDKTLVQPLTYVKGLGEKAIEQITSNRPYNTIEHLLFNEKIDNRRFNKKSLDVLVRCEALKSLMDERFSNMYHLWNCIVGESRPKTIKQFEKRIEEYKDCEDFSDELKIKFLTELTGAFPMDRVVPQEYIAELARRKIPPISEYDKDLGLVWFVVRNVSVRFTRKNNKEYWILDVIDSNSATTQIKCWRVNSDYDKISCNSLYVAHLEYDPKWGFSTSDLKKNFKIIK